MSIRHPMGVLHSFSIKNIFYDTMNLKTFLFWCDDISKHDDYRLKIIAWLGKTFYGFIKLSSINNNGKL